MVRSVGLLPLASFIATMGLVVSMAAARDAAQCQEAWGQAVRSYLTQRRTEGPKDEVFRPACELEAKGQRENARIEAILIGVFELVKLDSRGCVRFLDSYVQAPNSEEICRAGAERMATERLRQLIQQNVPAPPTRK